MKIKTTTHTHKRKIVGIVALIVIIAAATTYYFLMGPGTKGTSNSGMRAENTVDYSPAKPSDKIGESSKDMQAKDDQSDGEQPTPSNLTVTISNTSQDSSTVYVRAITENATSGQCKITLTHNNLSVTKSAALSAQANYGNCQGFNIPKTEFQEPGSWKIRIEITANNLTGSAETAMDITK